jgi:hypothetical protein
MRFYRAAAMEFLLKPGAPAVAHHLITRAWRPVGIEAIGMEAWWRAFGPLMASPQLRQDIMKIDPVLQRLPGFEGTFLLRDFFGASTDLIERYGNSGTAAKTAIDVQRRRSPIYDVTSA